jgi:hypothetical protein
MYIGFLDLDFTHHRGTMVSDISRFSDSALIFFQTFSLWHDIHRGTMLTF